MGFDWGLELGIGTGHGDWFLEWALGIGIWYGDWDWGLGIGIGDWDW